MNTEPTSPARETEPANQPQGQTLPAQATTQATPLKSKRRTGKIARLPKEVRDELNGMIEDGVPYLQIIERLGPQGEGLTEVNICNWKKGGYVDWVRKNQITEAIEAKYELAQEIVNRTADGNQAGRAALQAMAVNLCEFLSETDPVILRESLLSDADKFTRFINAMVRLAEGGIRCEVHGFAVQERTAEARKRNGTMTEPGVSEETLRAAERKLKLL